MKPLRLALGCALLATSMIVPGQARPEFGDGPGYRPYEWDGGWEGLALGSAPPLVYIRPPLPLGPPPIIVGLPKPAPARRVVAVTAAAPGFDAGPLIGAAIPPPIVLLPPPAEVVEGGPPPPIVSSAESGLVITPPDLAAIPIPAAWRVGGYVTSFTVAAAVLARRVVRPRHPVRAGYNVAPPPPLVVYEAPPPVFLGAPGWGPPRWHGGWGGVGW